MFAQILSTMVVAVGIFSFGLATDGFRAITTEGARQLAIARTPRELPDVDLVDHRGRPFRWSDLEGRPTLVEFIFTTCPDICQKMSADLTGLVRAEEAVGRTTQSTRFISITFDPENDTVERLREIADYYGADGTRWRFARISDRHQLAETLDVFGIVAIESPWRGFEHNAAIHGLNPQSQLARIADVDEAEEMLRWARRQIE